MSDWEVCTMYMTYSATFFAAHNEKRKNYSYSWPGVNRGSVGSRSLKMDDFHDFHQQVRFYLKNDNNKIFLIGDVNEQSGNKSSSPLSERRRTAPYLGIRVPIRFFNLDFFFTQKIHGLCIDIIIM